MGSTLLKTVVGLRSIDDTGQCGVVGLSTEGRTGVSPSALGLLAFRPSPSCVHCASLYLLSLVSFIREFCLQRAQTTDLPYFLVRREATKKL